MKIFSIFGKFLRSNVKMNMWLMFDKFLGLNMRLRSDMYLKLDMRLRSDIRVAHPVTGTMGKLVKCCCILVHNTGIFSFLLSIVLEMSFRK